MCLPEAAAHLADELQDWNQLGRYHEDNLRLQKMLLRRAACLHGGFDYRWLDLAKYFPVSPM